MPVVVPYESLLIRDHWNDLVDLPWWYQFETDVDRQTLWRSRVIDRIGQDWFLMPGPHYSDEDRSRFSLEARGAEVYRVDRKTGAEERLVKPLPEGCSSEAISPVLPSDSPGSPDEIDRLLLPLKTETSRHSFGGRDRLARRMKEKYGETHSCLFHVQSPLWSCYTLWGFNELMMAIADKPRLVEYACKRYLEREIARIDEAALLGADIAWIEECMTDMISPAMFRDINVPLIKEISRHIASKGLKSVYYYCGNPAKKLEMIISCGTDAVAFEEGKKGFDIDIAELAVEIDGRCVLFGNLDALLLEKASEAELEEEISRQALGGLKNRGRFVMSTGSPVTPRTSIDRVVLYREMAHRIGAALF